MPWCVQAPQGLLSVRLGLESIRSFPPDANDIRLGMIVTGVALMLLCYRTLTYLRYRKDGRQVQLPQMSSLGPKPDIESDPDQESGSRDQCAMRIIIAGYSAGTAMFAVSRAIWDTSKMLLVLAAAHNMAEWMLIGYLYFVDEYTWRKTPNRPQGERMPWMTAQRATMTSFMWIWLVITVTVSLPIIAAVLFEQSLGIACDYILVITFATRFFRRGGDPQLNPLWRFGLYASAIHFGQIWPLVIGTFGVTGVGGRVIEWTLIFTAALTFYFYGQFAILWERLHFNHTAKLEAGEDASRTRSPNQMSSNLKSFFKVVAIGYVLGFATIFGPAQVFGICSSNPSVQVGQDGVLTGYTRMVAKPGQGKALRQALSAMPPLVLKENGAIAYDLFSTTDSDHLLIIEKWQNMNALRSHISSSAAVNGIFRSSYVKNMIQSQELQGPWTAVDPHAALVELNVSENFEVGASRSKCWSVINDWKDCSWVEGCKSATLQSENRRLMDMGSATLDVARISNTPYTLQYEIMSGASAFLHYTGTIRLSEETSKGSGTAVSYTASFIPTPGGMSAEEATAYVKRDFEEKRIPFLQKLFSNGKK